MGRPGKAADQKRGESRGASKLDGPWVWGRWPVLSPEGGLLRTSGCLGDTSVILKN